MTGSNASLRGYPEWSVYAGSKAVLPAFARVWAAELRDRKIRVNVLTPGSVLPPMVGDVLSPELKETLASVIPRREGPPEEIASIALFLASDDSSYVNGQELVADGGTTVI